MPSMTGRPAYRTMEMNGGSSAAYLACTPCVALFCTLVNRGGNRRAFRLPGGVGIMSIVRWNLRPVIFDVECFNCFLAISGCGNLSLCLGCLYAL